MKALLNQTAIVTGASSGIGQAIALALAEAGCDAVLVGRRQTALEATAQAVRAAGVRAWVQPADLSSPDDLKSLADRIAAEHERIDILIHSAALHATGSVADTSVELLESQHRTNVAAPYALTRAWLPQLQRARGQVVFLNSSAGIAAHANLSQYAATKHALKAIADSLREEVNASQVRVLSVFAGRTATPLQERLFAAEGREYQPERLLQPSDVARMVLAALALPRTAEVTEIHIRPLQKPAPREEVL